MNLLEFSGAISQVGTLEHVGLSLLRIRRNEIKPRSTFANYNLAVVFTGLAAGLQLFIHQILAVPFATFPRLAVHLPVNTPSWRLLDPFIGLFRLRFASSGRHSCFGWDVLFGLFGICNGDLCCHKTNFNPAWTRTFSSRALEHWGWRDRHGQ